jgi:hypothetical protein
VSSAAGSAFADRDTYFMPHTGRVCWSGIAGGQTEFLADDVHRPRSVNAEPNRIGANPDNGDGNFVADEDPLSGLS